MILNFSASGYHLIASPLLGKLDFSELAAEIGDPPAWLQNRAGRLAEENGIRGALVVLAHFSKVFHLAGFKIELVDFCPVSGHPSVLLLLPLQEPHPRGFSDAVNSVTLLLEATGIQRQWRPEAGYPEPNITQPVVPIQSHQDDKVIERWAVEAGQPALHLRREDGHLEAQLGQKPGEEPVVLVAHAASPLVHYLVVYEGCVQVHSPSAVYGQILEGHRQLVTGVQRPQHLQAGLNRPRVVNPR